MPFGSLWLPVVLSAVAVWIVSAIVHMALRYHRADYKQLSDEDSVAQAVRKVGASPGLYVFPYCTSPAQMKEPALRKKFEDGPIGFLILRPNGVPGMGKNLIQWLLLCFLVSFVTAYVARHTLHAGQDGLTVLQITATIAFAGYGFGYLQDSIWMGVPWSNCLRGLLDAVLYSLTTGLVFRLLWPAA
jgi:hypothetical protein